MSDQSPRVADVIDAVRTVFDPEMGMSIVELGLVYGIRIEGDTVHVTMTLTTPGCPMRDVMTEWVRIAIVSATPVARVEVDITFDPPWSPDRIQGRPISGP